MHSLLKIYVDTIKKINPADGWNVVNADLEYVAISEGFDKELQVKGDILYKRFRDLDSPFVPSTPHLVETNAKKLINYPQTYYTYIILKHHKQRIIMYSVRVTKLIDPITTEFIGAVHFFNNIPQYAYITQNLYLKSNITFIPVLDRPIIYEVSPIYLSFNLKEQIIIWLLIFGKTYKEITTILSEITGEAISMGSLATIIHRHIYGVFKVHNNFELLAKLDQENALNSIPKPLFQYFTNHEFR